MRYQLWPGDVPFLFLPRGAHLCSSARCFWWPWGSRYYVAETGGTGQLKIVIAARRKGVVGMLLRKLYGIRKVGGAVKQEKPHTGKGGKGFPAFLFAILRTQRGCLFPAGALFLCPHILPSPRIDMG